MESVAAFAWNGWQASSGISGNLGLEYALASAPLNSLNSFTFLTPVFGLAIGMLLFGETFTSLEMIGIGITIVGLVIVVKAPRKTTSGSAVGEQAKVIRSS